MLGFVLANKKREGLTVRTNRGAHPDRAGDQVPGHRPRRQGLRDPPARLARCGAPAEAEPVPSLEEVGDVAERRGRNPRTDGADGIDDDRRSDLAEE